MDEKYRNYLGSDLWRQTRALVLDRDMHKCQACLCKAECVHHRSYKKSVMKGNANSLHKLISLCHSCHKAIEFDSSGAKRSAPAEKEKVLGALMLSLRSMSLADWQAKAMKYFVKVHANRKDARRAAREAARRPVVAQRTDYEQFKEMLALIREELVILRSEVSWLKERLAAVEGYTEEDGAMCGHLRSIATQGA